MAGVPARRERVQLEYEVVPVRADQRDSALQFIAATVGQGAPEGDRRICRSEPAMA
jgi:hypothetical protein